MDAVNLTQKFDLFQDTWHPRIVGELNGQQVKLVKLKGSLSGTTMMPKMNCSW